MLVDYVGLLFERVSFVIKKMPAKFRVILSVFDYSRGVVAV